MSSTASQIISIRYPTLAADPNVNSYISMATDRTAGCFYGAQTQLAIALRAAHMYLMDTRTGSSQGVSGTINSIKEGDLSLSFGSAFDATGGMNDLAQTAPGQELLGLMKSTQPAAAVTGNNITGLCIGS